MNSLVLDPCKKYNPCLDIAHSDCVSNIYYESECKCKKWYQQVTINGKLQCEGIFTVINHCVKLTCFLNLL